MGLIKTAMISGAAMYGVKQISKEAGRRYSQQPEPRTMLPSRRTPPLSSGDDGEDFYEPTPPPPYRNPRLRMVSDQPAQYEQANFGWDNSPQHQRRQQQPTQWSGPTPEYYVEPQSRMRAAQYNDDPWNNPRAPQQRQSGFVEPYEIEDPVEQSSSNNDRNAFLGQAVQYAQRYGPVLMERNKSKGDGDSGNMRDFISGFIRK